MKILASVLLVLFTAACKSGDKRETQAVKPMPVTIEEAVASSYRTPENTQRDQYRRPVETLNFFGLKPEMTVIEISPGAGWYMEVLAPLMNANGQYIAAAPPSSAGEYMKKLNEKTAQWLGRHPEIKARAKVIDFAPPADLALDQPADMILTFRNVHNWAANGFDQAAFNTFFKALKPGGILGVVEHRAPAKSKRDPKAKSGYMREADVIQLAKRAGFKLEAKSEINANPKDTRNHPEGVWTLPPVLRLGDKDREKYLAIGESDRMTLKFVKPGA